MKERNFYPNWHIEIQKGKILFEQRKEFDDYLVRMDGKKLDLIIKPRVKDRSRQEEKYYYGVVVKMISEEMDTEPKVVHEMLKGWFLRELKDDGKGRKYERVLSITELTDKAFREYWKKCQTWAALPTAEDGLGPESGLQLYIPNPNEVDYSNY